MAITYNPLLLSGFQKINSSAPPTMDGFGTPVASAGSLPGSANDGELRVVLDTHSIYIFNAGTSSWKLVTDPLTDIRQLSYNGTEQASFTDIPLFLFDASVKGFTAMVDIEKGSLKETFTLMGNKTSTTPQRIEQAFGEPTSITFNVIEDGSSQLQVQYKTDPAAASYKITFRAITLT